MQSSDTLYLVGDHFEGFAKHKKNVLPISQFLESLDALPNMAEVKIILGQGINQEQSLRLAKIPYLNLAQRPKPAALPLTHRHKSENVMISEPQRLDPSLYTSELLLEYPVEMKDHITGQHIPAMVINEAARQLFISVMEKYYLSESNTVGDFYFVLNEMNAQFLSYVFPIPAQMLFKVIQFDDPSPFSKTAKAEIEITQAFGRKCCHLSLKFGMVKNNILQKLESNIALEAIQVRIPSHLQN